jgi:hypothetical protein
MLSYINHELLRLNLQNAIHGIVSCFWFRINVIEISQQTGLTTKRNPGNNNVVAVIKKGS